MMVGVRAMPLVFVIILTSLRHCKSEAATLRGKQNTGSTTIASNYSMHCT